MATFEDANQVFIESFYKIEDKEAAISNYHNYASESGRIMKECLVKEAITVHFSRKYNEIDIEELIKE